ncbi:hypothetical protein ACHHYP_13311 [Achlya hypogyna]|uniref:Uncharacterized protein n=1 Tax=Achlya hypogyna TaxID=1202772 RepID=A0A1V9YFR9_ACHHY|nr:hypothetical protein ACHHYP_13311 [Achlya hypogyna]
MSVFRHVLERQVRPTVRHTLYHDTTRRNEHRASPHRSRSLSLARQVRLQAGVAEITCGGNVVFCRLEDGVCLAMHGTARVELNTSRGECVRSIYFNHTNESIILMSTWDKDCLPDLHCRSVPLRYVLRRKPVSGTTLFDGESVNWPGFVEFDEDNRKILTASVPAMTYKLWDLKTYELLYSIGNCDLIQEIKTSPGILLVRWKINTPSSLTLSVLAIDTGHVVLDINLPISRQRLDFVELFDDVLFFKQERHPLVITNVRTGYSHHVPATRHIPAPNFVFLAERKVVLVIGCSGLVRVFTFAGALLSTFTQRTTPSVLYESHAHVSGATELIVSCSRPTATAPSRVCVRDLLHGVVLAESPPLAGTSDATLSFAFDRTSGDVYSGDAGGLLRVWSCWQST